MTPQEIETAARRLLNAVGSEFWSQTEIIGDWLYMSAMELATETHCIENRYTTPSVASQAEYVKPSRSLKTKRIEYNGQKLKPIDMRSMDSVDTNLDTTVTGTPQYYAAFDDVFILYPAPDTAALNVKVWSIDEPSAITVTSTLEIPTRYHPKLVIGTAYYMSMKELGHPNTSNLGNLWFKAVEDVKKMERLRHRGDAFARVNTEETIPIVNLGAV